MNFQYQPIRCTDLIEVKNYFFSPFNWLCQVPAYLLRGSILKYTWTECKNRDPVFGFQVSRPHLERGERERERVVQYTQTDSNGIVINPLVFHWWNAPHYGDLASGWVGCILLVHWCDWYDWYQWNVIYSTGIPLVKCISLRRLRIFPLASGWEGVHSTRPLVRLVRLVPMEYHLLHWYSIGEMHLIMGT